MVGIRAQKQGELAVRDQGMRMDVESQETSQHRAGAHLSHKYPKSWWSNLRRRFGLLCPSVCGVIETGGGGGQGKEQGSWPTGEQEGGGKEAGPAEVGRVVGPHFIAQSCCVVQACQG